MGKAIVNILIYAYTYGTHMQHIFTYLKINESLISKILASFTPNFGISPFESKIDHITSYKAILYAFVLDGLLL